MKVKFLDLNWQYLSIKNEIDIAIKNVLNNSIFVGGKCVSDFEETFAKYQHSKYCISVANGTDALEIAIESLNLPSGSEIIVPANTFISTAEAVTRNGHKVIFADISPNNYILDTSLLEHYITPNVKAIIAVHLYGHPCEMDKILSLAQKYNLYVIEDCAQAHGAEFKNYRVGSIGHIAAFSFYPGKNLGAYGDAGAIITNDEVLNRKCRLISNHGRIDKYNHIIEGRNSRLDTIQASILNVKLKHLDSWIERRNQIAKKYISCLKDLPHITLPVISDNIRHSFHLFVIRTTRRDSLQKYLSSLDIETGIHYPKSLPKLEAFSYLNISKKEFIANEMDSKILSLPIGEHMTEDMVDYVIDSLLKFK